MSGNETVDTNQIILNANAIMSALDSLSTLGIVMPFVTSMATMIAMQPASSAVAAWNRTTKFEYTKLDLKNIASGSHGFYVYHGAPEEYADALVTQGAKIPYHTDYLARQVAARYELNWSQFQHYVHRHDVVDSISTAPALVAFRWASQFSHGEVLSDLNAHARILVEANRLGGNVNANIDRLSNIAMALARQTGSIYTSDNAPDILGLPDLYPRLYSDGAIVQIYVTPEVVKEHRYSSIHHDAGVALREMNDNPIYADEILRSFNDSYVDYHLTLNQIHSAKVVVRGIPFGAKDIIDKVDPKRFSSRTGFIRSV